jgi:TP901 family phage tail tape measure protein
MALNRLGFGIMVTARDLASSVLKRLSANVDATARGMAHAMRRQEMAMRSVALGGALTLGARAALRGLGSLAEYAGDFEQKLAGVGAITHATAAQLHGLHDAAIRAGLITQFSPQEAVDGLQNLVAAGQTAEQSMKTLIPVMDLAAGSLGQLGIAGAADAVVGSLNAYGWATDEAVVVTDKLLRITQLSNFQARDFEAGLAKAAATGATFGQSFNDVLVILGLLRNKNIDASSAATAYREAMRRMASDAGAQQAILGAGVPLFDAHTGKMREGVTIMMDLAEKLRGMTDEERNRRIVQAFGARGLLAFNAVLKAQFTTMRNGRQVTLEGRDAIDAMRREMDRSTGTAKAYRDALLDTAKGQRQLIEGAMQTLKVVMGEALAKMTKPFAAFFYNVLSKIVAAFSALPLPVKKVIMSLAAAAATITTLIGGVFLLKGAMGLMGFSFTSLLMTLGQLILIGPAVLILLGGFGIAAYAAYRAFSKNTGGIATSWQDMVHRIQLAWQGAVAIVRGTAFSAELTAELRRAENQGVVGFLRGFERFLERMKAFWAGLKRGFEAGVDALAGSSAMQTLLRNMRNLFNIFSGEEAADSRHALARFGDAGEATGRKLARLGELGLQAINTLVDLGKRLLEFIGSLSQKDLKAGIEAAITSFDLLFGTLQAVGVALSWIIQAVRIIGGGFKVVGTAIGEGMGAAANWLQTRSDYAQAENFKRQGKRDLYQRFLQRAMVGEMASIEQGGRATRTAAGDWMRAWGSQTTYGMEGTAASNAHVLATQKKQVEVLRAQEQEYLTATVEPGISQARRSAMQMTLLEIRDEIARLNHEMQRQRQRPIEVHAQATIGESDYVTKHHAAMERDAARDIDPLYMPGAAR